MADIESIARISADIAQLQEKKIYVYAFFVTNLIRHTEVVKPNSAHTSATRGTVMRSNYRRRVHRYMLSRSFYDSLLQDALLTASEYRQINAELLAKYQLNERSIYNDE